MDELRRSERGERAFARYVVGRERLVFTTRRHVATVIEPLATSVAAFVIVVWLMWEMEPVVGDGILVLSLVWLVALGRFWYRAAEWWFSWFGSTDRRLLLTTGLVTHKVAMMPLEKVTDMSYTRSALGQVLGYGRFVMESAGQEQALRTINFIPHPDETYRLLCATIFGRTWSDAEDTAAAAPAEPPAEPLPPSFPPAGRGPDATGPDAWTQVVGFVDPVRVHGDPWDGSHSAG
ncbi:MAG: PH domain-containing protein [Cellulomonas sp.]|nr:PH domain-containing protein [Cellulomonas sp.]